jgi:phosphohistidine phosphatase SixA
MSLTRWAVTSFVGLIFASIFIGSLWIAPWIIEERQEAATFDALQRGGYVIYLRHADRAAGAKEPFNAESPLEAFSDCTKQRNLTDEGRKNASQIGATFRRMKIPVGRVVALPLCRTRETAQLAFGAAELDPHLYDARFVEKLFAEVPPSGNLVIVDTEDQVRQIAKINLRTGEAAVFEPLGAGGYRFVGKLDQGDFDS